MKAQFSSLAFTALIGMAVVAAVGTASAWGCVPIPIVTVQPTAAGSPGTEVMVHGAYFLEKGTVEIRWDDIDGPKLATATGMEFSTGVTIPEVPAGLYSIIVLSRRADGSLNDTKAAAVFQVVKPDFQGVKPEQAAPATTERSAVVRDAGSPRGSARESGGVGPPGAVAAGVAALLLAGGFAFAFSRQRRKAGPPPPQ